MTAYAHLLVRIDNSGHIPMIDAVGIYSQSPENMADSKIYACILTVEADTFHKASEKMLATIKSVPRWQWMLPWIEPSIDDHMRHYRLPEKLGLLAQLSNEMFPEVEKK